jgi:hypothetical protein
MNSNGAFIARYVEQENASKIEQIPIMEAWSIFDWYS